MGSTASPVPCSPTGQASASGRWEGRGTETLPWNRRALQLPTFPLLPTRGGGGGPKVGSCWPRVSGARRRLLREARPRGAACCPTAVPDPKSQHLPKSGGRRSDRAGAAHRPRGLRLAPLPACASLPPPPRIPAGWARGFRLRGGSAALRDQPGAASRAARLPAASGPRDPGPGVGRSSPTLPWGVPRGVLAGRLKQPALSGRWSL